MKYRVITISRQYAAYGRTIAAKLSEKLGLPYYDKDFVKKTAEEGGFDLDTVKAESEELSQGDKFMNTLLNAATTSYSSYDSIFTTQAKVILDLSKEPCIIVGRCANRILRDARIPSFHIYLYADEEARRARAKELLAEEGKTVSDIGKYIEKRDNKRRTYFRTYTGREMDDPANYNLCLDVGVIGVDKCAEILIDLLKD